MQQRKKQQAFVNRELDIKKIRTDYDKIRIRLEAGHGIQ